MRKQLFLGLLLAASALAQNARFDGVVQSRSGMPAPGAKIAVCTQPATVTTTTGGVVTGCLPLANICANGADASCTQPNPVIADGLGNYSLYVPGGLYTFEFFGSGINPRTQADQNIGGIVGTLLAPGSNKFVTFNDNSALGGNTCMQFDKASGNFTVCGVATALSFASTGPGAGGFTGLFGNALPTPIPGNNGFFFDPVTGVPDCYQNGGAFTACTGTGIVANPGTSQNVSQPATGGFTQATSFNSNVFENIRYPDQFQWTQSPAGTVSVGANTITINQIRGISQFSASPGLNTFFTTHSISIAGTGTPEIVVITATTCTGATSGTCTVTFTAANSHSAGFTLGTATAGWQEAIVDAHTLSVVNPVTGWVVACSPKSREGQYVINATIHVDDRTGSGAGGLTLEGNQCTLEDNVHGAAMIDIGTNSRNVIIQNFHFFVSATNTRAADGTQIFVRDRGQGFHFSHNQFSLNGSQFVDTVLQVSGDQFAEIDHNDFENVPMKCDATWCGPMVYGDQTNSAAIGDIHDNYFSSNEDPLLWISGNGMTIKDNVFQNWIHYPWSYGAGFVPVADQGGNYYEGNCSLVNPDFIDVPNGLNGTSFACNTGPQVAGNSFILGSTERNNALNVHRFSSTGASIYWYYIVGIVAGKQTKPIFIGDASSDGVTPVKLWWQKFGATTYDVLRSGPKVGDGTDSAPYGTGNWSITTGLTCSVNPCFFSDTFAATSSYTVFSSSANVYTPATTDFTYEAVPFFMNSGTNGNASLYFGPANGGLVSTRADMGAGGYYDAIFTTGGIGAAPAVTGTRSLNIASSTIGGSSNITAGALIFPPNTQEQNWTLRKGKFNLPSSSYGTSSNSCWYQGFDSNSLKTFATPGHQPALDANDTCMGFDTSPAWLAFQGGANGISFYVNHIFDSGTSPVFQMLPGGATTRLTFTSTLATGTAPLTVTSTTPVAHLAATPTAYNAAGTQQTNGHFVFGTCTLGTSCAVTLVGSAVYTGAATYVCTAQDQTAIAATKVAQASGSAFTITGTGTDVLGYSCIGN